MLYSNDERRSPSEFMHNALILQKRKFREEKIVKRFF